VPETGPFSEISKAPCVMEVAEHSSKRAFAPKRIDGTIGARRPGSRDASRGPCCAQGMATLRRLPRLFTKYPIYFVTACTYNRRCILAGPEVHESFVEFALRGPDHGVWIGRYVVMPDHVHLFAGFGPESISLSSWQKSFKNTISKTLRTARFSAPHWEMGFFDHLIRSQESYEQKWSKVRENPVRAGLVRSADEWPYAGEVFELWRH